VVKLVRSRSLSSANSRAQNGAIRLS